MKKLLVLFIFVLTMNSCEKPCEVASTGLPQFVIEIIDKTTLENVFTNGTYAPNQLQVVDDNNNVVNFGLITENNINIISISPSWAEEFLK